MESHFISTMLQWFMYFLPTIVSWVQLRRGKTLPLPLGMIFFSNLFLGWTVVMWILLMANAFGYNPVPWVAVKAAKVLQGAGLGVPMNAPQAAAASPSQGYHCGQCGGSGSVACSQCQGRGSWYTQPTTAFEVSQLQTCGYCMSSGRIRCPNCGGAHL